MSSKTVPIIMISKQTNQTNNNQAFDIPFSPPSLDESFYFNRFFQTNTKPADEVDVNANYSDIKTDLSSIIQPIPSSQQQQQTNKNNLLRISLLKKSILDSISPTPSSSTDGSDSQESSESNTPASSPFQTRKHSQHQQQEVQQPKQASEFVSKMFNTAFNTHFDQTQQPKPHQQNKKCEQIKTFRELNSMVPDSL